MNLRTCIKNYFKRNPINDWKYISFFKFMKTLGYDNKNAIVRIYIRTLKNHIIEEKDHDKILIAEELLEIAEKERFNIEVNVYNIHINIFVNRKDYDEKIIAMYNSPDIQMLALCCIKN